MNQENKKESWYVDINGKKVAFDKLPCNKCEWRWTIHCPKCDWNAKGKYKVY